MSVLVDHLLVRQSFGHQHLLVLAVLLPITRQRRLFCLLVYHVPPTCNDVGAFSLYPSWYAPSDSSSSLLLLGSMSSQQGISPKEPEQEPYNRFSPLLTTRPCPFLPLTHDPPLLAGYRLEVSGSCTCSTSLLVAHVSVVVWRLCLHVLPCTFDFL